jgi:hypothetical protein
MMMMMMMMMMTTTTTTIEHMKRGKEGLRFKKYSYFRTEELGQTLKSLTHDRLYTTEKSKRHDRPPNYRKTGLSLI